MEDYLEILLQHYRKLYADILKHPREAYSTKMYVLGLTEMLDRVIADLDYILTLTK